VVVGETYHVNADRLRSPCSSTSRLRPRDARRGGRSGWARTDVPRGQEWPSPRGTASGGAARAGESRAAFPIAGGLLLFSIASEMVLGVRMERQSRAAEQAIEEHVRNIAAFPLATPLLAGPGAITATICIRRQPLGPWRLLAGLLRRHLPDALSASWGAS
jgi:MarC family integral membrane protein